MPNPIDTLELALEQAKASRDASRRRIAALNHQYGHAIEDYLQAQITQNRAQVARKSDKIKQIEDSLQSAGQSRDRYDQIVLELELDWLKMLEASLPPVDDPSPLSRKWRRRVAESTPLLVALEGDRYRRYNDFVQVIADT